MHCGDVILLTAALFCSQCRGLKKQDKLAEILPTTRAFEVGAVVNITCHLKSSRYIVSNMTFMLASEAVIDSSVLDNTTIGTTIGPLTLDEDGEIVYCVSNGQGRTKTLSRKIIHVGYPPEAPTDIICTSYSQVTLKCDVTGTLASRDNLSTSWTIEYTNSGLGGVFHKCFTDSETACVLGGSSNSDFNYFYPNYPHIFRITVTNAIASKTKLFEVDPWLLIKQDQVDDLRVIALNSTCLNVSWSYPSLIAYDLDYVITVDSVLQKPRQETRSDQIPWLLVTDLVPFSEVKVTVQSRPKHGGYLSDPKFVSIRMPQDKPSPPVIPASSFSVISNNNGSREIWLYWQAIPEHRQHGPITKYMASVYAGSSATPVLTKDLLNSSVSANITPLESNLDYRIILQAKNVKGFSRRDSSVEVFVPSENKVRNAAIWVDAERIHSRKYTVYWAPRREKGPSIVRLHWCNGEWLGHNNVNCKSSIQMKTVSNSSKHRSDIDVNNGVINCGTVLCSWNFGVSMETNGFHSGILWNRCRFKKYKAPDLAVVHASSSTDQTLRLTWEQRCLSFDQIGRPDYYEVGHAYGSGQCRNDKVNRVPASHGLMSETLMVRDNHNVTVCIRPVGGGRAGDWVIKNVYRKGIFIRGQLSPGVVAAVSISFLVLVVLFLFMVICLCKKGKCFAKIHIELPSILPQEYPLAEEQRQFLPVPTAVALIIKEKDNSPGNVEPLRSSTGSSGTKETELTVNTISCESPEEDSSERNRDSVENHCSSTDNIVPGLYTTYTTITAWQSSTSLGDSIGQVSQSFLECDNQDIDGNDMMMADGSYMKACMGSGDIRQGDGDTGNSDILYTIDIANDSSLDDEHSSSYEDVTGERVMPYDGANYLDMKHTTNHRTGCNVYTESAKDVMEYQTIQSSSTRNMNQTQMIWDFGKKPSGNITKHTSFGLEPYKRHPGYAVSFGNRKTVQNRNMHQDCQCMNCLSQRQTYSDHTHNINVWLRNEQLGLHQFTDPYQWRMLPGTDTGRSSLISGMDNSCTTLSSEHEVNDSLLQQNNNDMNYVKLSHDDEIDEDMSNGNLVTDYSIVTVEDHI